MSVSLCWNAGLEVVVWAMIVFLKDSKKLHSDNLEIFLYFLISYSVSEFRHKLIAMPCWETGKYLCFPHKDMAWFIPSEELQGGSLVLESF